METKEKIKVFINFQNGKTVCICKRSRKRCGTESSLMICWIRSLCVCIT